jgi:hypothetical protein
VPQTALPWGLVNQALSGARRRQRQAGARKLDFPSKISRFGPAGGPDERNPDEDIADLTEPGLSRFNRLSNPCQQSDSLTPFMTSRVQSL